MIPSRLLVLAATALALAAAAPAGAFTGYGVAGALRVSALQTVATSTHAEKHTCQAKSGNQADAGGKRSTIVGTVKNPAVVACEQPPRSHVLIQGLKQASAAALAAIG